MQLKILDEEVSCRNDADKDVEEEEGSSSCVDTVRKQRLRSMKDQLEVARELKQKAVAALLCRTGSFNNLKEEDEDGCAPVEKPSDEMQKLEGVSPTDNLIDGKREIFRFEMRQDEYDGEDTDDYERRGDWRIINDSMSLPFVASSLTADSLDRDSQTEMIYTYNDSAVLEQWVRVDDRSIDSLGLLYNHVTCNPADTVTWSDWVFWR